MFVSRRCRQVHARERCTPAVACRVGRPPQQTPASGAARAALDGVSHVHALATVVYWTRMARMTRRAVGPWGSSAWADATRPPPFLLLTKFPEMRPPFSTWRLQPGVAFLSISPANTATAPRALPLEPVVPCSGGWWHARNVTGGDTRVASSAPFCLLTGFSEM
jgi:hypothetical protein